MYLKQGQYLNRMMQVAFIFFIMIFTLTGCGGDEKNEKGAKEEDKSIVLSENGVGPINATTSFNMHQMTLAFNDYNVVEVVNYQSGHPYPVIRVSEGVKTLMTIIPDGAHQNIYSIIVEDNKIKNSLGHPLGTLYRDIYAYGQKEECQLGSQDMSGKVLCYAPRAPNILYVFNGNKNPAKITKIPPAESLQDWALESIIWRPKQ